MPVTPQPEPGFAEVWFDIRYLGDTTPMQTRLDFSITAAPTQLQVDAFFAEWQTVFESLYGAEVNLEGGHWLYDDGAGIIRVDSSIVGVNGTNGNGMTVRNTAVLVQKLTATGGKRGKGRMYWPGPTEEIVAGQGVMSALARDAWQNAVDEFGNAGSITTAGGVLGAPYLIHSERDPDPLAVPPDPGLPYLAPTPITGFSVQSLVATQRRRLRR